MHRQELWGRLEVWACQACVGVGTVTLGFGDIFNPDPLAPRSLALRALLGAPCLFALLAFRGLALAFRRGIQDS